MPATENREQVPRDTRGLLHRGKGDFVPKMQPDFSGAGRNTCCINPSGCLGNTCKEETSEGSKRPPPKGNTRELLPPRAGPALAKPSRAPLSAGSLTAKQSLRKNRYPKTISAASLLPHRHTMPGLGEGEGGDRITQSRLVYRLKGTKPRPGLQLLSSHRSGSRAPPQPIEEPARPRCGFPGMQGEERAPYANGWVTSPPGPTRRHPGGRRERGQGRGGGGGGEALQKARRGQPLGTPSPGRKSPGPGTERREGGKKPQRGAGSPSMATPQRGNPAPRRPEPGGERGKARDGGGGNEEGDEAGL